MKDYIEARGLRIYLDHHVYKPKEDSFLVSDNLQNRTNLLDNPIIEIGSGTGIILLSIRKNPRISDIAVDINYNAAQITKRNAEANRRDNVMVVCSDLVKCFRQDSIPTNVIFNPPYLPQDLDVDPYTPKHEREQLVGGLRGYETASRLLNELDPSENIVFVIISSLATNPVEFSKLHPNWDLKVIESKNVGFEDIWLIQMSEYT